MQIAGLVQPGQIDSVAPDSAAGSASSVPVWRLAATLVLGWMLFCGVPLAAAEPAVLVEIDRNELYEGESLHYAVTLSNFDKPAAPELKGFDDFTVTSLGESSQDSTSITIINGRRSEIVRRGRRYDYRLTPLKPGVLTIPAPIATQDKQKISGRAIEIRVIPPEDQDTVMLEINCDAKSVYPMQPFSVTLKIAVKQLPAPYSDRSPVEVQSPAPELAMPWVDDAQLPGGIEAKTEWREWLGPMQSERGAGFRINQIGGNSALSVFNGPMTFQPKPRRVRRPGKDGAEADYWEYTFTREFIPQKIGELQFGPVSVKGTFATRLDGKKKLIGEAVFAVAPSLKLSVKPVPAENRPESYIGAVGRFEFRSEISPQKARVGDPLTLMLTLRGRGTLEETFAPDLNQISAVAQRFKIYEATAETKGDTRRFTYSIRPLMAGKEPFPAIPISYFDVDREEYVTVSSAPISLEISAADQLSDRDIVASGQTLSASGKPLEVQGEGIFANIADPSALRNETVHPRRWLAVWCGMLGAYVLAILAKKHTVRRNRDPSIVRKRGAAARARSLLREAAAGSPSGTQRDAADRVQAAFVGLVADATAASAAGLTSRDIETRLHEGGIDPELSERIRTLLQSCDDARYGASAATPASLVADAEPLLQELLKAFKTKRLLP